ncbi:MAG: nuclear transport factor 2 family protein [Dehalococcoidia bacterium]|jgi:ketosteroid isomerase-like protein|nr:nuclear transport factor 2 family protein [Dehalococcoidia bacterium]
MSTDSHLNLIRAYFAACGIASADEIAAHFTEGATIYDTNHAPVVGRERIGAFWAQVRERWSGARWIVDNAIEDGDTAAIEWSMHGVADGQPFTFRGSEHYRFRDGLIDEIRQYWTYDPEQPGSALVDFDYSEFDAQD